MPIYKSFNGQEVHFTLGNYLCDLLYKEGYNNNEEKSIGKVEILKHPN
jgi:hypothetical protein